MSFLSMFPLSLSLRMVCLHVSVLGPFLDLLPACPRSASDPEDDSRDDSPITLGILTLPRAAFRERSLVLCQVSMCGAASQRYVPSVTQMLYLTFILVDWGLMLNPNERPTETISCNVHHRGNRIQMSLFAFDCSDVLRRIARHARTG